MAMTDGDKTPLEILEHVWEQQKITQEEYDKLKKELDARGDSGTKTKGRWTRLGIIIGIVVLVASSMFVIYSDGDRTNETIGWLLKNPPAAVVIIGFLSLVVSLLVFSFSWYLRDSESQNAMDMDKIRQNLSDVKNTLGEPAFTNLLNGLSSAAKEELVFPEPTGVLRHKEFRRALTISVALTYFAILGFSISDQAQAVNFKENPIIQTFAWVFVAVIAFYFGDKIFENYVKSKGIQVTANQLDPITITDATISKDEKNLIVTVRNNLKSKIKIAKIDVNGKTPKDFDKFDIEGEKSESRKLSIEAGGKTVTVEIGPLTFEKEIKENKPSVNNS